MTRNSTAAVFVGLIFVVIFSCSMLLADPDTRAAVSNAANTNISSDERLSELNEKRFRIDRSEVDSVEWQAAIKSAQSHSSGMGHYTLMRVFVDEAAVTEVIQVQGTKLKDLTDDYDGGGGTYRSALNGTFVFLEHINSDRRRDGRDPVTIGAFSHGTTILWVDVPANGELQIIGDIILEHYPVDEMGILSIKLNGDDVLPETTLTIGPIVVGGPYGVKKSIDRDAGIKLRMAPGKYKLLFPQFDLRKSRWDVEIESKQTTRVSFDVLDRTITKTDETIVPLQPRSTE